MNGRLFTPSIALSRKVEVMLFMGTPRSSKRYAAALIKRDHLSAEQFLRGVPKLGSLGKNYTP